VEKLTKAQKKALQKQEWQKEAEAAQRKEQMKKFGLWGAVAALVAGAILVLAIFVNSSTTQTAGVDANKTVPTTSDYDIVVGDQESKVSLIEYSDLQCPACASYHPIVKTVLAQYPNIKYVYRNFPLRNIHPNAQIAAQAGYAANVQGKFFEMVDLLFTNQPDWENVQNPQTIFVSYAQELGLDVEKFTSDMTSSEAKRFIDKSYEMAVSHGINSTPTFFLNGAKANASNYEDFKKLIDDALQE
jgi:protein-disulfide isomerase